MNPYLIIACLIAILGAGAGGFKLGVDHEVAGQARAEKLVMDASQEMRLAAAEAISAIKVKNTTIRQELEREIRTETVYADCKHSPDGLRLVNQALTNGAVATGDSELPKADKATR